MSDTTHEAPERIWTWKDEAFDVLVSNEHGDPRYTPKSAREYVRADRIEELEAKLEKAEVIIHIIATDKWDERLGEAVDLSCEYLAELKGQDDD